MPSKWIKCISTDGGIRGVAIQATELLQTIASMHGMQGEGCRALGEALMGGLLLSSYCKEGERINLNIRGSKAVAQALVDAHPDGTARGYIVERETFSGDDLGPWGEGLLSVLKAKTGSHEQPYIGTVPLVTGHLAKDLTFYWAQSEQVPSAVGLAVNLRDGKIVSAGGFLVQAMPGASAEHIRHIEQHIQEIHSLAERISQDADPTRLLSQIFQSTAFMLLEERELKFKCDCSWERVKKALLLVGADELKSLLAEDRHASVRCDFCSKDYEIDAPELERMLASLQT